MHDKAGDFVLKSFTPIFLDEFSSFVYPGFNSILNKARSSGIALHLSHQSLGDLEQVSKDFAKAVNTNTNVKCLLGLNDPDTADFFAKHIGTKGEEKITERGKRGGFFSPRERTGDVSIREVEAYKVHPRWEEWLKECLSLMKLTYRPSTLYSYDKAVNRWINRHWQGRELKDITKMDVHELLFEKMPIDECTMHTRKYILKIVKRIFQMAMDAGFLDRNPAQGMMIKVPESEKKVLTNTEVETFLHEAKATNHRFYPVWIMALFTGCRSGELFALKWSDVDFESKIISVGRSWNSKNGFTSTKNQKTRTVPISEELLQYLKELRLLRGNEEFILPRLSLLGKVANE